MSWLKVDDGCDEHPKIAALSDRAFRLWFSGLCYCGRQLTDGVIPLRQIPRLIAGTDAEALVAELTAPQVADKAPLWEWEPARTAVRVHDYLDFNPPASEVIGDRYAAKERMRVVRALRRLGFGDVISAEEWDGLPADLQIHFHRGRDGKMVRQKGSNGVARSPEQGPNVQGKFSPPVPVPSRPVLEVKKLQPPIVPRERGTGLLEDQAGGTAKWAVKAARPKNVTPRDLEAAVVRCLREIRQAEVHPDKCATAATSVLSLWRALGNPEVHGFADDLVLVARAAQMSGDKIFARDVRAEGWKDGTDRTFHVATICRHDRWDDRLRAAVSWGRGSFRVADDGVARARRDRWFDPNDSSSWRVHDEPVPMIRIYVECARRLFQDELAGDLLRDALARLDAMAALHGTTAEVTGVVRLAIDEVGRW